jgi:hypothetical protein
MPRQECSTRSEHGILLSWNGAAYIFTYQQLSLKYTIFYTTIAIQMTQEVQRVGKFVNTECHHGP